MKFLLDTHIFPVKRPMTNKMGIRRLSNFELQFLLLLPPEIDYAPRKISGNQVVNW
jgi:hypothetical protein